MGGKQKVEEERLKVDDGKKETQTETERGRVEGVQKGLSLV